MLQSMRKSRFQSLVRKHQDAVYSYAVYFLRNTLDAEDVVQEVLIRTWHHLDDIRIGSAKAWIFHTARNLCIDFERRRAVQHKYTEPLEPLVQTLAGEFDDPGWRVEQQDLARQIDRALAELPPRWRALIILREIQGCSYKEIAAQLQSPLNSVKVNLMRARQALREKLQQTINSE